MDATLTGIHHVTAIASDPQANLDFYTDFLGLRLVKKTVNFDDPGTYHFYFGDNVGSPGSILTFFPWPGARRGRHGSGQVTATSFAVPKNSLNYWRKRAADRSVSTASTPPRFGEEVLVIYDPDGLQLELIGTEVNGASAAVPDTSVDPEHAIARFHSATISEEGYESTARLLTDTMGFRRAGEQGNRFRFEAGDGGISRMVDVLCAPDLRRGSMGAGTVHHIAWRTPDDDQQKKWLSRLVKLNFNVSPIMERNYFHSIYYREPGGVLFEIATDPPGFAIDEAPEHLGEGLKLPPEYESLRSQIEKALPQLRQSAASSDRNL
jgi:catechol 2,3-dioxygenase-like lactoylglutathione lyase family enzyme